MMKTPETKPAQSVQGEITYQSLKTSALYQGFFYHLCLDSEGKITSSFLYKKGFNANLEAVAEAARKAFEYSNANRTEESSVFDSNISMIDREINAHNQKVDWLKKCYPIIQYIAAFFIDMKKYSNVSTTPMPQTLSKPQASSKHSLDSDIETGVGKRFNSYKAMTDHFRRSINFEQGLAKVESSPPRYYFWHLRGGKAELIEIVVDREEDKFKVLGKEFDFAREASNYILGAAAIEQHRLYAGEFQSYQDLKSSLSEEPKLALVIDLNEYYFCKNGQIYPLEIIMDGFKSGGSHIYTRLDDFINSFKSK